jgi:diguanylate cyclase (GGDEF)-like protein
MMQENKLFEALLDVIPFAAYAVDVNTYEVVYANKMMSENMYAPREEFCWKKVFGQEEVCSWCTINELKKREAVYKSEKLISSFFDEATDSWFQTYDELVRWPDGRTVKYSIAVDITEQKEIQASMITTHTKLAMQSKKLQEANEKLEFLAKKDFLTAINNRGNFFALAEEAFKNIAEQEKDIYIAMFDIDKFKNLNDTYGHKMGDLALKAFTKDVERHLDATDIFGRLGGEEFALLLYSECNDWIVEKVQKIRKDVEKIAIEHNGQVVYFTVSVGLVKKEDKDTIDVALERADKLLYNAKESGRNQLKFRL